MHLNSIQTEYYDEGETPSATFQHHLSQGVSYKKEMSPSGSGVALRIE